MSQQINLFNTAFEPQRRLLSVNSMALALGGLAVMMLLLGGLAQWQVALLQHEAKAGAARLELAQARMTQASAEFVPRKPDPSLQARLAEAEAKLAALQKVEAIVAKGGLGNTQGYAEYFRALARQGVDGLWLTGVSVDGAGTDIGVRGRALDPALVPGYIGRLRNEPIMQGKTIGNLAIDQAKATGDAKDARQPSYVEFRFESAQAQETKP